MISSIGQNNNVQTFSAVNAFKSNNTINRQTNESENNIKSESRTIAPKNILDRIDVNELRECAKTVGEYDISDEDIKYGLTYGRSVIAEFLC